MRCEAPKARHARGQKRKHWDRMVSMFMYSPGKTLFDWLFLEVDYGINFYIFIGGCQGIINLLLSKFRRNVSLNRFSGL